MQPVVLPANQPPKFYRGGRRIAEFRGLPATEQPAGPEDWIGSTVSSHGTDEGATRLPDGRLLRDAIAAEPVGYLGDRHLEVFGPTSALLVKLLDAGERLPVHCHPSREFAGRHFGSYFGKTEAWLVLATDDSEGFVHLGFHHSVSDQTVDRWFDEQDSDEILRAMNRIPVRAGDSVLVPAGMPHAIGAGVFLIELQEPTDFSVMLEWQAFGLDDAHESQLGMGGREALGCLDASAWPADTVTARFVRRRVVQPGSTDDILATDADPYFRALHAGTTRLPACFGVLVVTAGAGSLEAHGTHTPVGVGSTVLIPFAAAPVTPHGDFYGVLCLPPERAPAG